MKRFLDLATVVQFFILVIPVYGLLHSLDLGGLWLNDPSIQKGLPPLYSAWTSFYFEENLLDILHLLFIGIWVSNVFLLRTLFKVWFSGIIASILAVGLFSLFIESNIISPLAFDVLFITLFYLVVSKLENQGIQLFILNTFFILWALLGSAFLLSPLLALSVFLKQRRNSSLFIVLTSFLIGVVLVFYTNDWSSWITGRFISDLTGLSSNAFLSAVAIFISVLATINNTKASWGSRLSIVVLFTLLLFVNFYEVIAFLSLIISIRSRVELNENWRKIALIGGYLAIPFVGSIFFMRSVEQDFGKIGFNDLDSRIYEVSSAANIRGLVYNNERSAERVRYFFPEAKAFVSNDFMSSEENQQFELNSSDVMAWLEYKSKNNVKVILFDLTQERTRHLAFLGERLSDGEWALVFHEPEKIAILARRESENEEIIKRFEIRLN